MIRLLLGICFALMRNSRYGGIEDDKSFIFINEVRLAMNNILLREIHIEENIL